MKSFRKADSKMAHRKIYMFIYYIVDEFAKIKNLIIQGNIWTIIYTVLLLLSDQQIKYNNYQNSHILHVSNTGPGLIKCT